MTDTSSEFSPTDIAVVGMAGRFPGADDVGALWETVRAGRSGITRFTDDELRKAGVPADRLGDPAYVKAGAVVTGVEEFDAGFFGINPKEAQILDPQHRLFLEHSQHALEDAACDPARFDGAIGVFAGCAWSTYLTHNLTPANAAREMGEIAIALGNDKDTLATRVSHTLGLSGPAFSVQSACSTSLVAVCVAASSLANFECDVALAGGVSIGVPHRVGYLYQQGGIAPPDGECRAFDAAGLGAPLGGGVGVVALRRLEDALADGDRVYAVLRGWAVNNDAGRKVGFTAPGVEGQATVIAEALAAAGLEPADIGYVEAHGTGTALGDAAEIAALQQVFAGESLRIGSVKTNVGHLDRAAGVTNLIKAALALHHEEIPPTRNLGTPNPQLTGGGAELTVVTERTPWPRTDTPRRAGVSAFGIGGTNAHVVLEEAPLPVPAAAPAGPELLVWSARSAAAADAATANLAAHLESSGDALADVAHTLQSGRTTFGHRRVLVAGSAAEAARLLASGAVSASSDAGTGRRVGFLIAGTGEQYPGLAAELYKTAPVFRAELDRCRALLDTSVLDKMLGEREGSGGLAALLGRADGGERAGDRTEVLHPALFAVEYALAQLVRSWGVEPSVLVGYSLGEYVAACLAGVLSLEDALALVTHRAKLIAALPGGAMAAVPLPFAEVRARIAGTGLDIAALNGPQLTVVSGTAEAISGLGASLAASGVPCRPLATTHAFHSRQLAPLRDELTAWVAAHITLSAPTIPYVSNVTGELVTDAPEPAYWAEHMCAPVRFDDALATVLADEDTVLLELGPGRSLGAMVRGHRACAPKRWASVIPTLPGADDPATATTALAEAAGRLWLAGVDLDWTGVRGGRAARRVGLPGYPFQRSRYWIDAPGTVTPEVPRLTAEPDGHVQLLTPSWRPEPAPASGTTGRVAILPDSGGVAAALTTLLGEVVDVAEADTVVDLSVLDLDDDVAAVHAVSRTLAAAAGDGSRSVRVLVATRAGQAAEAGSGHPPGRSGIAAGAGGRREIAEAGSSTPDPARPAAAEPRPSTPRPAQAAVAVLPVVANQEYLNLDAGTVDLDPSYHPAEAAALLAAELRSAATPLVAYRGDQRLVPGYRPAAPSAPPAIRRGGSYLITGGLGGVGLTVAEHLVTRGARRLVLASRSGGTDAAVARLRALGADVHAPRVDVGDPAAVRALLTERFDGIVHAAADSDPAGFAPLSEVDEAGIARHFAAKVGGARVLAAALDELREADRPEWTLLFSSTSALLGGVTFGSYAAANAALLAEAHGRPGWVAAAWDTWPGTLERLDARFGASMAKHAMTRAQALTAFDHLTAHAGPAVIVAAGGLDERLPGTAKPAAQPTADRFPRPDLPQPYTPPMTATERGLAEVWSSVLGVEPVGTRDNFFDLNGNSLLALQMLALVKERFGVAIPTVTLFELPTVQALAATLDDQAPAPVKAPVVVADPDDDELDRHIAIVGMAGRFPGAGTVDEFWRNLCDGVESITFFSPDELIAAGVDPAQVRDPAYVPARPVLDDVTGFDAAFFGLSPRMAALTDPQQRLFLEVCWEALEQAGYARPGDRGRVGVFGGCNLSTYLLGIAGQFTSDADASIYELVMGNDKDALTTTVSYLFDLRGPSMAVQTFCSTSLVAVHTAMRSIRAGDCEMALAGGVSVRVPDRIGHLHSPGGQESPDGHVRTFDAQAHGSMFGDGATVVVLKKLGAALRDGDHIWSVIRGSAMNNDGALKVGYTAPSVGGQSRVIADAMADARVAAEDVGYVEAHGTATELGDPIEVAALTRAFGDTAEKQYCALGSVKPNVGHLDRAAGTAGLIKASLVVREGLIPPTLHYTAPNPEIDFAHSPFRVAAELAPWTTDGGRPRIAGLNSLGMGGTNVHVVVEQPPDRPAAVPGDPDTERRYQVLPVSARTAEAADTAARRLGEHLAGTPDARLADVAFTLQEGRKTFEHRRTVVASDVDSAAAALTGAPAARVEPVQDRPVAFLFAGVGEQYPGLVGELYRREPVFRAHLDECLVHLDADGDLVTGARGGGPGLAALLGRAGDEDPRAGRLQQTELAQPLMFAVDYALARTLMDWGLRPAAMLGYSLGEYVAACLAGVLSLEDALALVAKRAELIAALPGGSMAAVPLSVTELEARFDLAGIDIAAVNGPELVVVAGETAAVEQLAQDLRAADVPCRPLRTSHAFHSRMLAPAAAELTAWITANVTLNAPELPYLSNVTGDHATAELVTDPAYWARHMGETVRFTDAAAELLADEHLAVVEIGPGPSLGALLRGLSPASRWPMITATLPAADDPRPADEVLTDGLARLWLLGADFDWSAYHGRGTATPVYRGTAPGRVPLPTYPFQRQRYWIEAAPVSGATRIETPAEGPLEEFDRIPLLPEEQWINLPTWRQTSAAPAAPQPASWLVFARAGRAEDVLDGIRRTGDPVTVVRPGAGYRPGPDATVRPGDVGDLLALLRDLKRGGTRLDRVVHLWNLDDDSLLLGLHTLVALARAAGELGLGGWTLDLAATGTQRVLHDGELRPDAATLTGPNLVIPMEYPGVQTRLIDVDAAAGAAAVVAELHRPAPGRTVALRGSRRWVPGYEVLAPQPIDQAKDVLREHGVYLITGGLGGIGLAMAERLARDSHAKLVLFGRRGLPPRERWAGIADGTDEVPGTIRDRVNRVLEVETLGGQVVVVEGDVAEEADVRRAVAVALGEFGALHGILHTAGVPGTGLMQFKEPGDADQVFAPKLPGSRALSAATADLDLDFVALFSSITSVTGGGPGQVDYCAGNAWLDAYAACHDGRTVSISWGEWTWNAWDEGLSGYEEDIQTYFREHRAKFGIDFEQGWRTLLRALASGEPHVVVSTQDLPAVTAVAARFSVDAVTSAAHGGSTADRHPRPELVTPFQEPEGDAERAVAAAWCDSLRLDRVGASDNFFELGGTSLLGISLLATLRTAFPDAELPPHIIHEAPTVAALAKIAAGGPAAIEPAPDSQAQGQLRRSGIKAAAARRRRA
ncbi:SDR family NAD(P)-dependent oxidoreductase [Amycolatopsis sp. A133]|uniref:type I polyketide synthase n=1 Tax=Amycolatopsis sp. A133 TaxID=3064472 RepID=UPI0027EFF252|nr:SDR family NAD(P)-dependent oxidoreductase [Amycolatopsis sp. A133]MDQ7808728.1 SDR family NAD(P)-dependent oxidoreductase [Amycolatopsis sp. A133]